MILSGFSSAAHHRKYMKMTPAAEGRGRRRLAALYLSVSPLMLNSSGREGRGAPDGSRGEEGRAVASHFATGVSGPVHKQPVP